MQDHEIAALIEKGADTIEKRGYQVKNYGLTDRGPVCQVGSMIAVLGVKPGRPDLAPSGLSQRKRKVLEAACFALHVAGPYTVAGPSFQYEQYPLKGGTQKARQQRVVTHMRQTAARLSGTTVPEFERAEAPSPVAA